MCSSCDSQQPAEEGDSTPAKAAPRAAFKFNSVGSQFKKQLGELMSQLLTMEPHYVRCVKPNGLNQPGLFENSNALHQLRCGGESNCVHTLLDRLTAQQHACAGVVASNSSRHAPHCGRVLTVCALTCCCCRCAGGCAHQLCRLPQQAALP